MVYELKPPVDGAKGVLVLTHKERPFLLDAPPGVRDAVAAIRERYVVGMQWGAYHEDVGETPLVDFHMACPGTVQFREDADVRRIPLCSRNFTPDRFRPMDVPVTWDLLAVGHPIRVKRFSELLDAVRMAFDRGHRLRVLLVCAIPDSPEELGGFWDREFFEKYRTEFSESEREYIDLAAPVEADFGPIPLHPIPNEVFPYLYNASNAFTLFSREEGQSKVVHEALLCGTPVVVREDLRGGGRDYLDERNSVQFSSTEEASEAFVDIAKAPEEYAFDPAYLRPELAESETADRLEAEIRGVFDALGERYAGEIEKTDLAFKLGSHTVTLPERLRRGNTNDLRSRRALLLYAERVADFEADTEAHLAAARLDLRDRARQRVHDAAFDVGTRAARYLDDRVPFPVRDGARTVYERLW